jgi:tetratricopeptide (TPR) repeat protein
MGTRLLALLLVPCVTVAGVFAQPDNARQLAREPYEQGLVQMRAEDFAGAVRSFQRATTIDPTFELAQYMLGRAHLAGKSYQSAAVALARARELYLAEAGRQFETRQEYDRYRRDRVGEIDMVIGQLRAGPQSQPIQMQIQQLEERKRQLQDWDRAIPTKVAVPAFVSLSLGSAHFRSGNLPAAETAWLEAVAANPRVGEAHNNLAVVYLETGRFDEAERAVKDAERAAFRVSPDLKQEIRRRRKAGGG